MEVSVIPKKPVEEERIKACQGDVFNFITNTTEYIGNIDTENGSLARLKAKRLYRNKKDIQNHCGVDLDGVSRKLRSMEELAEEDFPHPKVAENDAWGALLDVVHETVKPDSD